MRLWGFFVLRFSFDYLMGVRSKYSYMRILLFMSSQPITAAVAGASGYSGGELIRLVVGHPKLDLVAATAASNAGRELAELHPQLAGLGTRELEPTTSEVLGEADVVFLALPHGESAAIAEQLSGTRLVVDLGADYRLHDPNLWSRYYGGSHAGSWTYALPELPGSREHIAGSKRIANPGCYPTSIILSLYPLLSANLIEPEDIVVVAASGTSGAGRKGSVALSATEVAGSMRAYKPGGTHQHTPEIEQALSLAAGTPATVLFTPLLAPMPRGIIATSTARITSGTSVERLREAMTTAYQDEAFVHVLPDQSWPTTAATLGSNSVHLQLTLDERSGRVTVVAALDNLIKGAAGQAVQNANLALGLSEGLGLPQLGVAP